MHSQSSHLLSGFYPLLHHPSKKFPSEERRIHFYFTRLHHPITRYNQKHIHVARNNQPTDTTEVRPHMLCEKTRTLDENEELVDNIKLMLTSMGDGRLSISAYDTAWVGLVEDINGSGKPQFPSCLEWIAKNQHPDGSWGEAYLFSAYDRLLCTLACIIALKRWNLHLHRVDRGILFIEENMCKLEGENGEHMTSGFEIVFPSLVEMASKLDIKIPHDCPALQDIYAKRNLKLSKIPKEILHTEHTTLLYSLEGIQGLDWERILKLQFSDGSMFYSPASTAYAFMHTKDKKSLRYLSRVVEIFNGAVPHAYPVDLLTRLWAVDRLQRLGISRYFQAEIDEIMNYVYSYWTELGIYSMRDSLIVDLDDTAMGFRLLRLHGYAVSPDVFWNFKYGDKFCCFPRQMSESATVMFNLYRASQVLFPGEKSLVETKEFSYKFLQEKQAQNQLQHDKWVVLKDFPGEVKYALDVPWYANLPRVESRSYMEQYGGENDIWIAKTFNRMSDVNNNNYLELAKLDYKKCQDLHQTEWDNLKEWCVRSNLRKFQVRERMLLVTYFLAAASIFEPERSIERLAWTKSAILLEIISYYLNHEGETSTNKGKEFLHEFVTGVNCIQTAKDYKIARGIVGTLLKTLRDISSEVLRVHDRDIRHYLHQTWQMWLTTWHEKAVYQAEIEVLVSTINLCAGHVIPDDTLCHQKYKHLSKLTCGICHQLRQLQAKKVNGTGNQFTTIDLDMQKLVELVFVKSKDDIDTNIKQTFLTLAKSYYYSAHCTPETINIHIAKVLFQRVL